MVSISESDSTKYQNDSGLGLGYFFLSWILFYQAQVTMSGCELA